MDGTFKVTFNLMDTNRIWSVYMEPDLNTIESYAKQMMREHLFIIKATIFDPNGNHVKEIRKN